MSEPTDLPALPAIAAAFLTSPGASGPRSWVCAQVSADGGDNPSAPDALSCSLLLHGWELTICLDETHAELFFNDAMTTITMLGDWREALRDLRLVLADPRLDLLLAMSPTAEPGE